MTCDAAQALTSSSLTPSAGPVLRVRDGNDCCLLSPSAWTPPQANYNTRREYAPVSLP